MHITEGTTLFIFGLANVAGALRSGKWCPRACDLTLGYATFNDTDPSLSRKVRQCRSELRITSLYLCFDEFCNLSDGEVPKFITESSEWCNEHAAVTLPPFHDVVDRWTADDRAGLPRYSADRANEWPVLNETVLLEEDFFERGFTTLVGSLCLEGECEALIRCRMLHSSSTKSISSMDGMCITFGSSSFLLALVAASSPSSQTSEVRSGKPWLVTTLLHQRTYTAS